MNHTDRIYGVIVVMVEAVIEACVSRTLKQKVALVNAGSLAALELATNATGMSKCLMMR